MRGCARVAWREEQRLGDEPGRSNSRGRCEPVRLSQSVCMRPSSSHSLQGEGGGGGFSPALPRTRAKCIFSVCHHREHYMIQHIQGRTKGGNRWEARKAGSHVGVVPERVAGLHGARFSSRDRKQIQWLHGQTSGPPNKMNNFSILSTFQSGD